MKKALSLILVLAMVLAMAPAVFAANDWEGEIDTLGVAIVNGNYYDTVQAAVDAADGNVVTLLADSEEAVTATDLYLDLNGHSLSSITVSGTLYGMDSATDEYVASGAKIGTVNGTYAAHYQDASAKRYLAIAEVDGVSFHRFYMGITKLSLAPAVTGFGYKAEFCGDEAVQAQISNIGYKLWLGENTPISRTADFKGLLTLRLKNYDVDNYGETDVNACVFITLNDGTVIPSATYAYSMRDMVEAVNESFADYKVEQQQAVYTMCEKYETMASWSIANILAWKG